MPKFKLMFFVLIVPAIMRGQAIDVESFRLNSASELIVKNFRGDSSYWQKYKFDSTGRATSSEHYFDKELRAGYKYIYNEYGLLKYEIQKSYHSKDNSFDLDTTFYRYRYFENGMVQTQTEYLTIDSLTTEYLEYNQNGKPLTYSVYWNTKRISIRKFQYDNLNRIVQEIFQDSDSTYSISNYRYNQYNDVIQDSIVYYPESDTLNVYASGWRFPTENYKYKYDELGRWLKKYLINGDKDILLETREYRK